MADKKNSSEAAGSAPAAPPKVSKNEAVRLAVEALGGDAPHAKLRAYVMEHFGHDMSIKHVSASLSALTRQGKIEQPSPRGQARPAAPALAPAQDGGVVI